MAHDLSLHHLSLRDVAPERLPAIAAGVGLRFVSVFVRPPSEKLDIFPRIEPGTGVAAFRTALAEAGVGVQAIEVVSVTPEFEVGDCLPALDIGADIGARRLTVLVQDRDHARAADAVRALADQTGDRGIAISLEFMAFSELRSLQAAARFVASLDHPGVHVVVDPLHLMRTGGTPADLATVDPAVIGAAQLCDGPLAAPKSPFAEAVEDRGLPGEGEFDLQGFDAGLPADIPVDLEVPMTRLAAAGWSPEARAAALVQATRSVLG